MVSQQPILVEMENMMHNFNCLGIYRKYNLLDQLRSILNSTSYCYKLKCFINIIIKYYRHILQTEYLTCEENLFKVRLYKLLPNLLVKPWHCNIYNLFL
jgi:hypothetical protein